MDHRRHLNLLARVVTAASLVVLAACDESPIPLDPGGVEAADGPPAPSFGHGSTGLSAEVRADLAALRHAMAPFHDFGHAEDADMDTPLTVCWFHSQLGGMGYHYGDPANIDGNVELLRPEALLYEPGRGGSLRLVAVEYIVPVGAWTGQEPPSLFGQTFNEGGGLYTLHAWVWRHNPRGLFADWNPMVDCDHAEESQDRA